MTAAADNTRIRFATFELDVREEQLRKGGSLVRLAPQPMKILIWLTTHAGKLVTRQELREQTWPPETVVDFEQGLNHCIKEIRIALGDDSDSPRFIETVPKRGYRFIADVRVEDGRASAETGKRRWTRLLPWALLAATLVAIALSVWHYTKEGRAARPTAATTRATLAVVPFEVLNRPEDIGYLALGIPDAITARLAGASEIRVRPTGAVMHSDPAARAPADLARALDVEYLLTGTLQATGDNLRVTLQLVRGADTASLWAEHYDLPRANLLSLEDTIAEKVAATLKLPLMRAERARLGRRYTSNPKAYESYLKGRSALLRFTKDGTLEAVASFSTALEVDPDYAQAEAGLASASAQMHLRFAAEDEVVMWGERAKREAASALAMDADLAEVHEALAAVYGQTDFDWPRTISESRQALALNPSLARPHYYLARAYYHYGLLELIENEVAAGLDIDPVNRLEAFRMRGTAMLIAGRFEEAKQWLAQARQLSGPTVSDWYYAQALYYSGDHRAAVELLRSLHGSAQGEQRARATLASFAAASGDRAGAKALLDRTLATAYMDHHVAYSLGVTYAELGQPARALTWLRKAADTGFPCYPWFSRDPLLQSLHHDGAFNDLLADLQKRLETVRTQYR